MNSPDNDDPLNPDLSPENEPDLSVVDATPKEPVFIKPLENGEATPADLSVLQNLNQIDPQFKLVDEQAKKIISMKNVEDQLVKDDTIDQARAEVVQEAFGGILDKQFMKGGLTKIPTRVGLREVKTAMRAKISKEEYELQDLFQTYLSGPLKHTQEVLQSIRDSSLPGLLRITESLRSELEVKQDKILSNPSNILPLSNREFVNIVKCNLLKLDTSLIKTELKTMVKFKQSVKTIQEIGNCNRILLFVRGVIQTEGEGLTLTELTQFVLSPRLRGSLEESLGMADAHINEVAKLVKDAEAIATKPEELTSFVVENGQFLTDVHHNVWKLGELVYFLTFLNLATKQILVTCDELLA